MHQSARIYAHMHDPTIIRVITVGSLTQCQHMFALRNQTHTARLRTKVDMNRCGKCGPVIGRILVAAWIAYVDKTSEARVCCTRMPFNNHNVDSWRCLHVSNPTKKASTCKRDHDADYERNKRSRAYRQQWEKEFSWLTYDGNRS